MTDSKPRETGQCRCGQVQFEASSEPLMTMACHCMGCQQMTASAFSLSTLYSSSGFKVTLGEPVIGGLRGATRHYFCAHCMSWLFTRPEGMDDFVNVRSTIMDDVQSFSPFIETYTDEKLPWATTPAVYSFNKFPQPEDFPALLAEFAKQPD
ncbi:GFA family protein [Nodosilinea sp. E11]|uniref:GFA family protein n=1 Tax=Nodosilinea sp. E11 TaxID=3037479 RepID=UPI0029344635|nr:GFA family protein [Nodosilinea sp. E11]WOD38653.1 GFA family protein [Nodosilinea sp. E11]